MLRDKRVLVTGVLTPASIAFSVAKLAQEQGADVVLTSFGRGMAITERAARRLPCPARLIEVDITNAAHVAALTDDLREHWGQVDGVVHSIGFAPPSCLGGEFVHAPWDDVSVALQVSAYSLQTLAAACLPLMEERGGSIVSLDFDARQAWPHYDWMGVAKAALESTARYLARDLGPSGIRVNLVCAGPLRTMAAKGIPGFSDFETVWAERAPLGWDPGEPDPVARACVALLSDWFPSTTGEMVHVDGGFHAVGA